MNKQESDMRKVVFHVEYYSNDEGDWLKCSPQYKSYSDCLDNMRLQALQDQDIAHRLVESEITTVVRTLALSAHGEELIK